MLVAGHGFVVALGDGAGRARTFVRADLPDRHRARHRALPRSRRRRRIADRPARRHGRYGASVGAGPRAHPSGTRATAIVALTVLIAMGGYVVGRASRGAGLSEPVVIERRAHTRTPADVRPLVVLHTCPSQSSAENPGGRWPPPGGPEPGPVDGPGVNGEVGERCPRPPGCPGMPGCPGWPGWPGCTAIRLRRKTSSGVTTHWLYCWRFL